MADAMIHSHVPRSRRTTGGSGILLALATAAPLLVSLMAAVKRGGARPAINKRVNMNLRPRSRSALGADSSAVPDPLLQRTPMDDQVTSILERISDGFLAFDRAWRFSYANAEGAKVLGRDPSDLLGNVLWDKFPELDNTSFGRLFRRAMDEGMPLELEDYYAPLDAWFAVRAYPSETGLSVYVQHVTERRRFQEALRRSEDRYQSVVQATADVVWRADAQGRVECATAWWLDLTGQTRAEALGWGWLDALHPADRAAVRAAWGEALQKRTIYAIECRVHTRNDSYRTFAVRAVPIWNDDGALREWIGAFNDITARKEAEAALAQQNATLREQTQWLDLVYDAIMVYGFHDGAITLWNRGAEAMYGWTRQEAIGQTIHDLLRTDFPQPLTRIKQAVADDGHWEGDLLHTRRDGSQLVVASRWALQCDAHGRPQTIIEITQDITARKRAETERDQLLVREREARTASEGAADRLARLQRITAALAEALTPAQVGAVVIDQGLAALHAHTAFMTLLTPDGSEHEVITTVGYDPLAVAAWQRFPATADVPIAEAVRTRQPIWNQSAEARAERYPHLAKFYAGLQFNAWVSIPLLIDNRAVGGLSLSFEEPRALSESERDFMLALARQCAQALERARLYAAERQARAQAEAARQRIAFLAEASSILASTLDYEATLGNLSRIVVPTFADWYAVDLVEADQTLRRVVIAHRDPAKVAIGWQIDQRYHLDLHADAATMRALRSGEPLLVPEVSDAALEAAVRDDTHRNLLRQLGIRSSMLVPLVGRNGPLGMITFIAAESGRSYDAVDLELAQELARRAAIAIDNAQLFRAAQVAEQAKEEARLLLDTLFETAPIGLGFFDTDLRYSRVNDALAAINGIPAGQHIGQRLTDLLPHMPPDVLRDFERVLETGVPIVDQEVVGETPAAPGVERNYLASYYPVVAADGTTLGLGAVVLDITDRKRAEADLRASEERYRSLVDAMAQIVWTTTAQGEVEDIPLWRAFTGQSVEEIRGAGWLNALHPDDRRRTAEVWAQAVATRSLYQTEYRIRRADGVYRYFSTRGVPVLEANGQIREWVGTCIDITDRKRSEEAQRFLTEASALLVASLDYEVTLANVARLVVPRLADWCAIDILDEDGTINRVAVVHSDPAKVQLAHQLRRRYPPDPHSRYGAAHVLKTGRSELMSDIPDALLTTAISDPELLQIMRGLGLRSSMVVPLIAGGRILGAISFVASESQRRFDSFDLALAEDLARRAAVAVDNARLYRASQEAILARDEFLSIASHELKTPLTSLQLQAQSLMRTLSKGNLTHMPVERLTSKLQLVNQQSERLANLADELLDVARLRAGRIEFRIEELNVAEVVRDVALRFDEQLRQAGSQINLHLTDPLLLWSDRSRLDQIVTNLLSNALKYGAGKPIDLLVEGDAATARLIVRDHGIGIAPEHLERIFVRFERAVSARNYGGLGLGLYIVRQIIEALGGSVSVTSEVGVGSVFTVTLPRMTPQR